MPQCSLIPLQLVGMWLILSPWWKTECDGRIFVRWDPFSCETDVLRTHVEMQPSKFAVNFNDVYFCFTTHFVGKHTYRWIHHLLGHPIKTVFTNSYLIALILFLPKVHRYIFVPVYFFVLYWCQCTVSTAVVQWSRQVHFHFCVLQKLESSLGPSAGLTESPEK